MITNCCVHEEDDVADLLQRPTNRRARLRELLDAGSALLAPKAVAA